MSSVIIAEVLACVLWIIYRVCEMAFTRKCMDRKFTKNEMFINAIFTFFGLLGINELIILGSWG